MLGAIMLFEPLELSGAYIIKPEPQFDHRGFLTRIFCAEEFKKINHSKPFVQVNHTATVKKGSFRGLHFQNPPHSEIKIIKCIKGTIFDIILDLRKDYGTFSSWHGEILSAENMKMIYIPEGCAHGFQTLENDCELLYFHTEYYNKESEAGINVYDPLINIKLPLAITDISERDKSHKFIDIIQSEGNF